MSDTKPNSAAMPDCTDRLVRQSFVEWRDQGRMVMKGQRGTRDPQDGVVKFTLDQTREIPGNLWDDLGHECTDYDGDGY